jgi:PIN domain nuclease of toxin-antitoxin system
MIALLDTHIIVWWYDRSTWLSRVELEATRGWDPADRIIVATARVLGVPLVTSDTRIIGSTLVSTIS